MKKFFSLVAIAAMVSMVACKNNAETEGSSEMDSTAAAVETTTPETEVAAPVDTTAHVDTAAAPAEAAPAAH